MALSANDQAAVAAARIARQASAGRLHPTSAGPQRASLRVGVALSPRHGRNAHLLIQRADEAYAQTSPDGRRRGLRRWRGAGGDAAAGSWVADEIVAALNERRIGLAFQPIVPTRAGAPAFEEALVRLRLADGATLGPDAFVPIAEKLGLIELIDERVLELAAARLAAEPQCRLSVNVSMATLRASDWFERLRDRLSAAPGAAERLTVELVETQAIGDVVEVARILSRVKALGVQVAMDDFGAGHTSFRNLRSLGVDMVKIDGAFVCGLAPRSTTASSCARWPRSRSIWASPPSPNGSRTPNSARLLTDWGVDYLQGHYIGRAVEPTARARRRGRARERGSLLFGDLVEPALHFGELVAQFADFGAGVLRARSRAAAPRPGKGENMPSALLKAARFLRVNSCNAVKEARRIARGVERADLTRASSPARR